MIYVVIIKQPVPFILLVECNMYQRCYRILLNLCHIISSDSLTFSPLQPSFFHTASYASREEFNLWKRVSCRSLTFPCVFLSERLTAKKKRKKPERKGTGKRKYRYKDNTGRIKAFSRRERKKGSGCTRTLHLSEKCARSAPHACNIERFRVSKRIVALQPRKCTRARIPFRSRCENATPLLINPHRLTRTLLSLSRKPRSLRSLRFYISLEHVTSF